MTIYYVGPGGSDGNNGTTWALRKLTLNGAEDIPVVANDIVRVGPGTYREQLTLDVSGSSGQPITYIADVTGELTDGVGGQVRITGSDDDDTATRSYCITGSGRDYRTFRGFTFDIASSHLVNLSSCDNAIVEDCTFQSPEGACLAFTGSLACLFRRNVFMPGDGSSATLLESGSSADLSGTTFENCMIFAGQYGLYTQSGGIEVYECTFIGGQTQIVTALPGSPTALIVEGCIFSNGYYGIYANATGEVTENYNSFFGHQTALTNVTPGANSVAYAGLFQMPLLLDDYVFPHVPIWTLHPLSGLLARTPSGNGPSDDLYGRARPATASKESWGAVQGCDIGRDTGTTRGGSTASLVLADVGRVQFRVPVPASSITISVYVYREANYAGTLPQMIIREPGQSARTTTDTLAASQWNLLTDTFTPQSEPGFVIVELISNNTAGSGSYKVYFDDLTVT